MQTPAERRLIDRTARYLEALAGDCLVLNIGAGSSAVIEDSLSTMGARFICDRLDVDDCRVLHPAVRDCHVASVESMPLPDGAYKIAFANYVIEHVGDVPAAAREIARVLQPGGRFIVSAPNPRAPEFMLSRFTPLWFHRYIRETNEPGHGAHETHYAYESVDHLARIFRQSGLHMVNAAYYANTHSYLNHIPLIDLASRAYDAFVGGLNLRFLMGNVCLTFKKPVPAAPQDNGHRNGTASTTASTTRAPS